MKPLGNQVCFLASSSWTFATKTHRHFTGFRSGGKLTSFQTFFGRRVTSLRRHKPFSQSSWSSTGIFLVSWFCLGISKDSTVCAISSEMNAEDHSTLSAYLSDFSPFVFFLHRALLRLLLARTSRYGNISQFSPLATRWYCFRVCPRIGRGSSKALP